jgi:hypothetical protein
MSLTDQQRIETAADNCEVLRARLAKYEDDQGNPKARPSGAICANDWFLALPPERQAVLREDKWLLADAAFKAGQSFNSSPVSAPTYRTYTTTPGEAVAGIALRQLGDESRWVEVRDLNAHAFPDIGPHDYYPVGTELRLPALSAPSHGEQVRADAERFNKLLGWMSSNVADGWNEVCRVSAVATYVSHDEARAYLDDLPQCSVGLAAAPSPASQKEQGE